MRRQILTECDQSVCDDSWSRALLAELAGEKSSWSVGGNPERQSLHHPPMGAHVLDAVCGAVEVCCSDVGFLIFSEPLTDYRIHRNSRSFGAECSTVQL